MVTKSSIRIVSASSAQATILGAHKALLSGLMPLSAAQSREIWEDLPSFVEKIGFSALLRANATDLDFKVGTVFKGIGAHGHNFKYCFIPQCEIGTTFPMLINLNGPLERDEVCWSTASSPAVLTTGLFRDSASQNVIFSGCSSQMCPEVTNLMALPRPC